MGNTFINTLDYEKLSFSFTLEENIMFRYFTRKPKSDKSYKSFKNLR